MSRSQGRLQVPDDIRECLLDLTITYLLEQPEDFIGFAIDYFDRLREQRTTTIIYDHAIEEPAGPPPPDEAPPPRDDDAPVGRPAGRRKCVFAEAYNPEGKFFLSIVKKSVIMMFKK